MRFLRFSIRRLLLLTGLIAILLFLLLIRPVTLARQFVLKQRQSEAERVHSMKLAKLDPNETSIKGEMDARTWKDILQCQQRFTVKVSGETYDNRPYVVYFDYCATPFYVKQVS